MDDLLNVLQQTIPLSTMMHEEIEALRDVPAKGQDNGVPLDISDRERV